MDFESYSILSAIGKTCLALGVMFLIGKGIEKALKFDMEGAVDSLEKAAQEGNAMPLAVVLSTVIYVVGSILARFI